MRKIKIQLLWVLSVLLTVAGCTTTPLANADNDANPGNDGDSSSIGFLVVAPDRGYLGNEELRDAFAELAAERNAALVFMVDDRSRGHLEQAVNTLRANGATRVVALPLYITEAHPQWKLAKQLLAEVAPADLEIADRFGASYLAVEILSDHFRDIAEASGRRVVVVGYGATDQQTREQMTAELQQVVSAAAAGFDFEDVRVLVWHEFTDDESDQMEEQTDILLEAAVADSENAVIVPFQLGMKLDGMMSFVGFLKYGLPENTELLKVDLTPHPAIALWMRRQANRHSLSEQDLGVVLLAHGSDFFWNETMREALDPIIDRYRIEFAFSMADQPIVERAIRRLEARGARAIVVVRVFGMADSFQHKVERMIGNDVEMKRVAESSGHRHGMAVTAPPARIRSAAVMTTVGGLEDHPLFAEALTARARAISQNPASETVILVAHGLGDDERNDHWLNVLESLATQMRADGGDDFRAIKFATWREDWPDKREPSVEGIREQVQIASENEGRALVIPARTNGRGGESELLDGLDFELGEGFAPHPLFARWVEEQIREGRAQIFNTSGNEAFASIAAD